MNNLVDNLGGRKFVLTVILMAIFTVFVLTDKMTSQEFITAVLVNMGIFSVANVTEKRNESL